MNIERLTQMAEWLEAGAPHVVFNMAHGREAVDAFLDDLDLDDYGSEEEYNMITEERDTKGLGKCGTVCCIAGYAVEAYGSDEQKAEEHMSWERVKNIAMRAFDLPENRYDHFMGHDLFDPGLAPDNCTPQQAAQAVRNCIANDGIGNPWVGVE